MGRGEGKGEGFFSKAKETASKAAAAVGQAAASVEAAAKSGAEAVQRAGETAGQAATEAARKTTEAARKTTEAARTSSRRGSRRTPPSSRPSSRASSPPTSRPASRASSRGSRRNALVAAPAPALEIFHPLFPPGEKPSLKGYERLVHTKQTEIDLVMTENAQLRLAMDRLERELTTLAEALQEKDREVRKMQISIDDRDHEIRQLSVVRSQSEGKDEAMKIAARQNREILRILQEANLKAQTLAEENARLKGELQREYVFGERRMRRSTQQNERLRRALEGAQHEISVNVLAKLSATELSKTAVAEREEMRKRTDAELEAHHDELNERRQRQYVLTSQLLDAKDQAYRLENQFESLIEQRNDETERAEELEARLENAVADLEETETALEQTHSAHAADVAARAVVENQVKATNTRSEALQAALQSAVAERRRVREWHQKARDDAAAANATAQAAEAAAKRSLARHVDTLTDVRKQKAEKRALQGQLDRTRLVLGRTRHKLTATLNHPPAMHKASGVTKERRRRRRPVEEQPSVRRRADEEPSWRSSATAPSRHPLAAESSVLTVPSTYAPAPAPAPA